MILGRDILTSLVLDLKFSRNIIIGVERPYEGFLEPIVDLINYHFKILTEKIVKQEEYFINSCIDKCLKFKGTISSTRRTRRILEAKCKSLT